MAAADPHWPRAAAAFLADLAQHNTREWFQANTLRHDRELAQPAKLCLADLRARLAVLCGTPVAGKIFRLARDMRFAKGAAPYHVWLRMAFRPDGPGAGYFLSIEPSRVCFGVGLLDFDGAQLAAWRAALTGDAGVAFDTLMAGLRQDGWRLDPPALKRLPAGVAANAPGAEWLRYKEISIWRDAQAADFGHGRALERWCLDAASDAVAFSRWLAHQVPAGVACAPGRRAG